MSRREYDIQVQINGRQIARVVIDSHYEVKHGDSVDDPTILELIAQLVWLLEYGTVYIGVVNAYRRK